MSSNVYSSIGIRSNLSKTPENHESLGSATSAARLRRGLFLRFGFLNPNISDKNSGKEWRIGPLLQLANCASTRSSFAHRCQILCKRRISMKCSTRRRNCDDRRRCASHNAPRMESAQIKSLPLMVLRFSRAHFWEASLVMNDINSLTHFCTNSFAETKTVQTFTFSKNRSHTYLLCWFLRSEEALSS